MLKCWLCYHWWLMIILRIPWLGGIWEVELPDYVHFLLLGKSTVICRSDQDQSRLFFSKLIHCLSLFQQGAELSHRCHRSSKEYKDGTELGFLQEKKTSIWPGKGMSEWMRFKWLDVIFHHAYCFLLRIIYSKSINFSDTLFSISQD